MKRFSLIATVFSLTILLTGPSFTANNTSLANKIESYVQSLRSSGSLRSDERTAWIVYDLADESELVAINPMTPLQAASMIKPFVALAFFHEMEAGKVTYTATARKHMELMIQKSSNESTNWIMRQIGGPAAISVMLKQYYPELTQGIHIVEYIPEGGKTYLNQAAGRDYAKYLHALWYRRLPQSSEILRIMGLPGTNRLCSRVKSVPEGTQLYNKTGSTAMCCGDMGILVARGRDGKQYPYLVVGIIESAKRNTSSYSTWITNRANMIREVSNIVYLDMKTRHPL